MRDVVHASAAPFVSRCGADYPNMQTTIVKENVTCDHCCACDVPNAAYPHRPGSAHVTIAHPSGECVPICAPDENLHFHGTSTLHDEVRPSGARVLIVADTYSSDRGSTMRGDRVVRCMVRREVDSAGSRNKKFTNFVIIPAEKWRATIRTVLDDLIRTGTATADAYDVLNTWNNVIADEMSLPRHGDGVRVILWSSVHENLTHALASLVMRPRDADGPLVQGAWKLWYYMDRDDLDQFRVVAWKELEALR
jgi:hypothetical protein